MEGIKESIFKFLRLDNLIRHLTGYVETRLELFKLEIKEEVARAIAHLVVLVFLVLFGLMLLLFLSIGVAQWLNAYLGQTATGYFVVGGVYFLLFLLFIIFKKPIDARIERAVRERMSQGKDKSYGTTGNTGSGEEALD
ncbi:MAG TPA: hypothetical protein DCE81_13130 [Cytophagales bacterium]|nr:phage holin family protein [Cyclobacteriaceae bacterium]HAC25849.1 hypothetical protein [Cytophagales bacterium]